LKIDKYKTSEKTRRKEVVLVEEGKIVVIGTRKKYSLITRSLIINETENRIAQVKRRVLSIPREKLIDKADSIGDTSERTDTAVQRANHNQ